MGILQSTHPRRGSASGGRWLALLLFLALVAAACGTDDATSLAEPESSTAEAEVESDEDSETADDDADEVATGDDDVASESPEPVDADDGDESLAGGLTEAEVAEARPAGTIDWQTCGAVSYTHLTLPTNREV